MPDGVQVERIAVLSFEPLRPVAASTSISQLRDDATAPSSS